MRRACVTDYGALYGRAYFGHDAGVASFDPARLMPPLLALASEHGGAVLDLGGGNRRLAEELAGAGLRALTVDVAEGEGEDYVHFDLSRYDPAAARSLRSRAAERLGPDHLTTCFDVAEHFDIEHVADFALNLRALLGRRGLMSISHRPSSADNAFHATILPFATWARLLALAGVRAVVHEGLSAGHEAARVSGVDPALAAIAHWQRTNPFRSPWPLHQTYAVIEPFGPDPDPNAARRAAAALLDIAHREEKRRSFDAGPPNEEATPELRYHLNFVQDWSFLRSLLDVWPAGRARATIRTDLVAQPYARSILGWARRTGLDLSPIRTVHEGFHAMDYWGPTDGTLTIASCEGYVSATHLAGSQLMLESRRRGSRTLTLQHGLTMPHRLVFAAAAFGVWDEATAAAARAALPPEQAASILTTGSPKLLDAALPGGDKALAARFGPRAEGFARRILVGTNLHWDAHVHDGDATFAWLDRLLARHPETLFVLRPHPDDASPYERPGLFEQPNLIVADEMTLLALDWSIGRLARAVDGVLTTYSTLALDALAAGRPVAFLPYRPERCRIEGWHLDPSVPLAGGVDAIPCLTAEEWAEGRLPEALARPPRIDNAWLEPSQDALRRIAAAAVPDLAYAAAEARIAAAALEAGRFVGFDHHPHADREHLAAAVGAFLDVL